MLTPPPVGRSPLLAGPGSGALLILVDVPLDELKAAGRAAGASLNDAFVAALLGGARRYHEVHGVRRDSLPVSMPVSVRTAADPLGGNKFAGVRFAGPMSEVDPATRMHLIGDVVRAMRHEPAIGFLEHVASAVTKLPDAAIVELSASIMSASDLQMSNIRGLPDAVELAGARVTGIYPLGPRPGVAAMITMITYDGTCCIGIKRHSPTWSTDVDVFEVHPLGGSTRCLAPRPHRDRAQQGRGAMSGERRRAEAGLSRPRRSATTPDPRGRGQGVRRAAGSQPHNPRPSPSTRATAATEVSALTEIGLADNPGVPVVLLGHGVASVTILAAPLLAGLKRPPRDRRSTGRVTGSQAPACFPRGAQTSALHAVRVLETRSLDELRASGTVDLVGHSLGAQFSLYTALDAPGAGPPRRAPRSPRRRLSWASGPSWP